MITLIVGKNGKEEKFRTLLAETKKAQVYYGALVTKGKKKIEAWVKFLDVSEYAQQQIEGLLGSFIVPSKRPLFIDYPENYLHPKTQVELGDLAILVNRSRDSVWMTNSEHMLLRLLRRIRETTEGRVFEHPLMGPVSFTKDQLRVIHMPQDVVLEADEDGEFVDHWPEGFFDERRHELF